MSDLRTAAQQALEAMTSFESGTNGLYEGEFSAEIAALRAALAEEALQRFTDVNQELEAALAEPVPVAWMHVPYPGSGLRQMVSLIRNREPSLYAATVPLYTAPPQRKPLTEEEIREMFFSELRALPSYPSAIEELPERLARAIERAHGIT